jgi:hypothetical protein
VGSPFQQTSACLRVLRQDLFFKSKIPRGRASPHILPSPTL